MHYDTVITGGRWFDGMGSASGIRNIGLRDGHVETISSAPLDSVGAEVIEASGQWVMPGMIDIHTHYPKIRSAGKPRIFSAGMERINFVSGVATAWGRGVAAACRCPALS